MRTYSRMIAGVAVAAICFGAPALAESIEGRWDATLTVNSAVIPFRLDISGSGATLKGTLYNGDDPEYTTKASFNNGKLVLDMEHYLTKIVATMKNGELDGKVQLRGDQGAEGSPFHAKRYVPAPPSTESAPSVAGCVDRSLR